VKAPFVPGELIVCVDASGIRPSVPQLRCGAIYTVSEIDSGPGVFGGVTPSIHDHPPGANCCSVKLCGVPLPPNSWYCATRFDKYRPEHSLDEIDQRKEVNA
jgi:hypothetical protein